MKSHCSFPYPAETRYIRLNTSLCQACWACVTACPQHVLGKINLPFHKHAHIDRAEKCKGCLRCVEVCPNEAIYKMERTHDNGSR